MNSNSKKHAIFVAAMLSATAISMSPALAADNLMDFLFGSRRVQAQPVYAPKPELPRQQPVARAAPVKRVTVTAPKNYDYKPDGLVRVDFSRIDLQLTGTHAFASGCFALTASANQNRDAAPQIPLEQFGLKFEQIREAHILAEKDIADAIVAYYALKQQPIWTSSYDVSAKAKAVAAVFNAAGADGLDPKDYAVKLPSDDYDRANIPARLKELADFELTMSARALRYAMDQGDGRINPNRLSGFHDFAVDRVKPRAVIEQLASTNDAAALLKSFEPQNKWYAELKQNLHELGGTSAEPTVRVAPGTMIRPGEENPEIRNVVALIKAKAPKDFLAKHEAVLQEHLAVDFLDQTDVFERDDLDRLVRHVFLALVADHGPVVRVHHDVPLLQVTEEVAGFEDCPLKRFRFLLQAGYVLCLLLHFDQLLLQLFVFEQVYGSLTAGVF